MRPEVTSRRAPGWRGTLAKVAAVVLVIVLANVGVSGAVDKLEIQIWPEHMEAVDRAVLMAVVLYVALMAIPFLPGIEVGLLLMAVLGGKGVVVVYVCTLISLTISYGLGVLFPGRLLASFLSWINLRRAAAMIEKLDALPSARRLDFLTDRAPRGVIPALLKNRYLTLALLLNVPGNALIGGGGGIAMIAGVSGLFSFPKYLLLIAVAILPGPILIMLSKVAV